jgi:hypothetical protein
LIVLALVAFATAIVGYFFVEARGRQSGSSGDASGTGGATDASEASDTTGERP